MFPPTTSELTSRERASSLWQHCEEKLMKWEEEVTLGDKEQTPSLLPRMPARGSALQAWRRKSR